MRQFNVITANLNGIRSAGRKGFFPWMLQEKPDIVCVQELKAQHEDLDDELMRPGGYQGYFHCAKKKGYSGTGIYTLEQPNSVVTGFGVEEFDDEGRYIELNFDKLTVVSTYLPSGSSGEHRQASKFRFLDVFLPHLQSLFLRDHPVIVCGDWNIAHTERDLKNWKGNLKNSGFLPEERAWVTTLLELGWRDAYRSLHPEVTDNAYTWWSNRGQAWANNVGWRLDYQLVNKPLQDKVVSASIYKMHRFSDHAPLTISYAF